MVNMPARLPHIVVLCGAGGSGKTSVSAALGLGLALLGRKVITFTIDPARRLADSLGVQLAGSAPQTIDISSFGPKNNLGLFQALMLNQETIARELIDRYADSTSTAGSIINNPVFRLSLNQLPGAEEFLALGKLYQLITDFSPDVIVVDTAPSKHALDFFQGSDRLLKILEPDTMNRIKKPIRQFIRDGKISKIASAGISTDALIKIAGAKTINSSIILLELIAGMYTGFLGRVEHLKSILLNPELTSVYLVTTPTTTALEVTQRMIGELQSTGIAAKGTIFNQVTMPLNVMAKSEIPTVSDPLTRDERELKNTLTAFLSEYETRVKVETHLMNQLLGKLSARIRSCRVPQLSNDVHSMTDIYKLQFHLKECIDWIFNLSESGIENGETK